MRKDEHLKIVNTLENKIQKLEKELLELKAKNAKIDFDAKLYKFISDQRRTTLDELLKKNINTTKYMMKYDKVY